MTIDELKRATKHLGGLFSGQVTQELAVLVRKDFREREFKTVLAAIEDHKRASADGFLNYAKLLAEIAAASRPAARDATANTDREGSWSDAHRRQNAQLRDARDYEVILRVHRGWWHRCPQTHHWRTKLAGSAVSLLFGAGMPLDEAGRWAEAIFSDPDYFRQCLEELRDHATAATAEPAFARA